MVSSGPIGFNLLFQAVRQSVARSSILRPFEFGAKSSLRDCGWLRANLGTVGCERPSCGPEASELCPFVGPNWLGIRQLAAQRDERKLLYKNKHLLRLRFDWLADFLRPTHRFTCNFTFAPFHFCSHLFSAFSLAFSYPKPSPALLAPLLSLSPDSLSLSLFLSRLLVRYSLSQCSGNAGSWCVFSRASPLASLVQSCDSCCSSLVIIISLDERHCVAGGGCCHRANVAGPHSPPETRRSNSAALAAALFGAPVALVPIGPDVVRERGCVSKFDLSCLSRAHPVV